MITTRDAPIHASGHGYAEELKLMLNLTKPRYVMPVHGDYRRLQPARRAGRGGGHRPPQAIFHGENGLPLEIDERGARFGEREQAGMIFVDGVDVGDIEDVALRDRRMLSADGIFIVVATISGAGRPLGRPPEIIFRGVPFLDEADGSSPISATRWSARSSGRPRTTSREIALLQDHLHDDVAEFVYQQPEAPADDPAGRGRGLADVARRPVGDPPARPGGTKSPSGGFRAGTGRRAPLCPTTPGPR